MNCDVAVIGAGVMGCAVAWRLRRRGLSVVVLERSVPGAEASSAAAGILSPQTEGEGPGPLLDLMVRSRELYPRFVAELMEETGIDVGYRTEGTLSPVLDAGPPVAIDAQIDAHRRRLAWQRARGLRVEWLGPEEVVAREPSLRRAAGALYFPDDHQVEAPLLAGALAQAAARSGARFVTAHVERIRHDGKRVEGVAIEGDGISCAHVVVAAGSWSALVEGALLPTCAVRPMRGQMLELFTRPPVLRHVVFGHVVTSEGEVSGYLVPRRDGRLVVGSTMELVGFRKEVTVSGLRRLLALSEGLCPTLCDAELRRAWAGFRPYTADHLPLLGPTPVAGLHLCTGHFRNGILLCPVSAEAVCALIGGALDGPLPDLTPFSVMRLARNVT